MSDQELLVKIKELVERDVDPIPKDVLSAKTFLKDPRNVEIKKLFDTSNFGKNKDDWEWHQVVRFALKKADSEHYMYDKLWNLLLKHRGSYDTYFVLETEEGTFPMPNPLTDLNRFESLYNEFFKIYKNIISKIHFDFPKQEFFSPNFRGKINWQKTIQKSNTEHPLSFASDIPVRKFVTPGNILLILCVLWMHRESVRILQLEFSEPLDRKQEDILQTIADKTKNILLYFPFQDVIKESTKYWNLQNDDKRILTLEAEIKKLIAQGIVRNPNYSKLLDWLEQFRNLNLWMVSENLPVRNLLRSQKSQDTVYEAWMFMEFFDYFYEKGLSPILHLDSKPYSFEFEFQGQKVIFWYERQYNAPGPYAWALQHKPDFTVMVDGKIIGVFDAKNFSLGQEPTPAINKILSYMSNLNTKFGILFFPFIPEFWNEWTRKQRHKAILPIYSKKYPEKTEQQILSISKPELGQDWQELNSEFKAIFSLNSVKPIPNPQDPDMALYLMRMEPADSEIAIIMKNQTIQTLFDNIIKRIPMVV